MDSNLHQLNGSNARSNGEADRNWATQPHRGSVATSQDGTRTTTKKYEETTEGMLSSLGDATEITTPLDDYSGNT